MRAVLERAEIQRLGGDDTEWRRMAPRFSVRDTANCAHSFARSALSWLIRHRAALDDETSQRALDWGFHRFTEDARFSFANRSLRAVLEQTIAYERELELAARAAKGAQVRQWAAQGWALSWRDAAGAAWSVRELTNEAELAAEGAAQRHCVGLYASACVSGRSAVFQLLREEDRAATIEVQLPERQVVQARSRFNAAPSPEAMAALRHWAAQLGLAISERA